MFCIPEMPKAFRLASSSNLALRAGGLSCLTLHDLGVFFSLIIYCKYRNIVCCFVATDSSGYLSKSCRFHLRLLVIKASGHRTETLKELNTVVNDTYILHDKLHDIKTMLKG